MPRTTNTGREVVPPLCYMCSLIACFLQNQPMLRPFGGLQFQNWDLHWTIWRLWPWWMVYNGSTTKSQWPSTGGHCSSSQACTPTCCRGLRTGECRYGIICRCGCRTLTVLLSYRRGIGLLHDTSPQDHNTQQYYEQGYELHVLKFGHRV